MARLVSLTDEDIDLICHCLDRHPEIYSFVNKIKTKLVKSQKRIKNASAKSKGREFQFWVCRKISELLNIPYNQQDDECLIHSREMSQQGVDIVLRGEARERLPIDFECKAMSTMDIPDAVKQADENAGVDRLGAVAFRQTNTDPVVIFSWGTFEKLFRMFIDDSGRFLTKFVVKKKGVKANGGR